MSAVKSRRSRSQSPANKQARIVADVVCGKPARYTGAAGYGDCESLRCGRRCNRAWGRLSVRKRHSVRQILTISASNASYYPGADMMFVKLIFDPQTGRLFGGQIVGGKGVDKRTDVLAVAIRAKMNVFDLQELELAYAPAVLVGEGSGQHGGLCGRQYCGRHVPPVFCWKRWMVWMIPACLST